MLATLKAIGGILNTENAPIKWYHYEDDNIPNSILYLLSIEKNKQNEYDKLTDEEKESYVSDSAKIYIPLINVDKLYDLYHKGVSCDYSETIKRIQKKVTVTPENEKVLFAVFLILHEFGHWHDFVEKEKKPFFYNLLDENEYREAYELKKSIIEKLKGSSMSSYDDITLLKRYFNQYNSIPREKRANEYADEKLVEAYKIIKEKGLI